MSKSAVVEPLTIDADTFLDKTAVFYGPTKTGKSYLMNAVLAELSRKVEQTIIFCPTDAQNAAYSGSGMIPPQMVHWELRQEMLETICERQEMLMGVYTQANKPEIIAALFAKIPHLGKWRTIVDDINSKLAQRNAGASSDEAEANRSEAKEMIIKIKKSAVVANKDYLATLQLTDEERYALDYMSINPRLTLVFDDCTPELNTLKKTEVIKKIFFQGRWMGITALIAAHTDKALDPEIKKGVFINVFTHQLSVHEFFERASNNIDRDTKNKALAATSVFEEAKHQKLIYIRDGGLRKVIAKKPQAFSLCNPHIEAVCKQVEATTTGGVSKNNRFYSAFYGRR